MSDARQIGEGALYNKILVTLDATPTDGAIIEHIKALATTMHSRVALLHVCVERP